MFDFEDTKGVTRSRKTKDRQYNIDIRTKHYTHKTRLKITNPIMEILSWNDKID
jgi:hypothetical protein